MQTFTTNGTSYLVNCLHTVESHSFWDQGISSRASIHYIGRTCACRLQKTKKLWHDLSLNSILKRYVCNIHASSLKFTTRIVEQYCSEVQNKITCKTNKNIHSQHLIVSSMSKWVCEWHRDKIKKKKTKNLRAALAVKAQFSMFITLCVQLWTIWMWTPSPCLRNLHLWYADRNRMYWFARCTSPHEHSVLWTFLRLLTAFNHYETLNAISVFRFILFVTVLASSLQWMELQFPSTIKRENAHVWQR